MLSKHNKKRWYLSPTTAWALGAGLLIGARSLENRPALYLPFGISGLCLVLYGFGSFGTASVQNKDAVPDKVGRPIAPSTKDRQFTTRIRTSVPYRSPSFILLMIFLSISAANSLYPPIRVVAMDIFDEQNSSASIDPYKITSEKPMAASRTTNDGYEAGRDWVTEIGKPAVYGGMRMFDKRRYILRELILIAVGAILWVLSKIWPDRFQQSGLIIRNTLWLWPLTVYAFMAARGMLYVPCLVVLRRAFERSPERTQSFNLWLWQVDGQVVRYSLILYQQIVLFICVLFIYGFLYVFSTNVRTAIRSALRRSDIANNLGK